ncbi:MAG: zf-HC2 domain-containing protein [Polyangiaceae bacterium]|nr:zf-HC2 domain-containing protein [Polyangiaceae bacterium]
MSAARSIDGCARCDGALSAYVDGELDPGHAVDLEAHVRGCGPCAERLMLLRAMRASMKKAAAPRCPDALRARIAGTMAAERARAAARAAAQGDDAPAPRLIQKRYVAALAAAAGVVFAVGMAQQRTASDGGRPSASPAPADPLAVASVESLLDDLVVQHAQPLPPETTNPEDLPRFDPFVGVPVRRPAFQPFHVDFKGARVHTMRDRRAALLQYTVSGGHRVTVYMFNSRTLPVQKAPVLRPRLVRERPVYVGRINGYSVAAAERSGVGYALATDLNDDESTQLVLAAMQ